MRASRKKVARPPTAACSRPLPALSGRAKGKGKNVTRKVNRSWGYHLIVNAAGCDPEAIRSKDIIRRFSDELVARIDMVAYGKPHIVRFGTSVQKGYTLVQLIETSCISAHFSEDTNEVYLDVFSCKTFRPKDALEVFTKYFSPKKMGTDFFIRQAPRL